MCAPMVDASNKNFSDVAIQAFVDGELTPRQEAALLENIIESDEAINYLNRLVEQKILLKSWWNTRHKN